MASKPREKSVRRTLVARSFSYWAVAARIVLEALEAGGWGYVHKKGSSTELLLSLDRSCRQAVFKPQR